MTLCGVILRRLAAAVLWQWCKYNQEFQRTFSFESDWGTTAFISRLHGWFKHEFSDNKTLRRLSVLLKWHSI